MAVSQQNLFDTFEFANRIITDDSDLKPDELESDDENFYPQPTDEDLQVLLCEKAIPKLLLIGSQINYTSSRYCLV